MAFLDIFTRNIEKQKTNIKPKIIVDMREKQSLVISSLIENNFEIEFKQLHVGDYIVKNTIIERKTISDFISSMLNKRLIRQLKNLQKVKSKILLIEGIDEHELYHENSTVNENAIRGMLLSIILNYNIPILFTKNHEDTAKFLKVLSQKPNKEKEIGINDKPKPRDVKEQLQYILEGFPGIGPKTAKKLLTEYKTLKEILNTDIEELKELIGKKAKVFEILDNNY